MARVACSKKVRASSSVLRPLGVSCDPFSRVKRCPMSCSIFTNWRRSSFSCAELSPGSSAGTSAGGVSGFSGGGVSSGALGASLCAGRRTWPVGRGFTHGRLCCRRGFRLGGGAGSWITRYSVLSAGDAAAGGGAGTYTTTLRAGWRFGQPPIHSNSAQSDETVSRRSILTILSPPGARR